MADHVIDPQLDTSFLVRLLLADPPFVAYAAANRAAGLRYSPAAADEFLAGAGATLALGCYSRDPEGSALSPRSPPGRGY